MNTTVTRIVNVARFYDYSNYHTQLKARQKSTIMNISEAQNKLGDYVKTKLIGKDLKLIKESENYLRRAGGKFTLISSLKMKKLSVLLILLIVKHWLFVLLIRLRLKF